jgi:hypothetical protein
MKAALAGRGLTLETLKINLELPSMSVATEEIAADFRRKLAEQSTWEWGVTG